MRTAAVRTRDVLGYPCEIIQARFRAFSFARHFHETFSVGLVTGGVNVFSYRGERIAVPAGSICIADPGEVHDGGLEGAAWAYTTIFVPPDLFGTLSSEDGGKTEPAFARGLVTDRKTCSSMAVFLRALQSRDADGETLHELAVLALGRLLRSHAVDSLPSPSRGVRPTAKRAIEIITDNRGRGVSLASLARETGTSRYGVIRAVSAAIGLTPTAYMTQLRVERARELIRAGMPIADAAVESGFSDQSHLTRAMKRRWGVTPGALKPTR